MVASDALDDTDADIDWISCDCILINCSSRFCCVPLDVLELDGGSHWIPDEHWADVSDVVLEHLAAHSDRS